jgi:threonine/homoserine/homoserine lactone efflux protein
MLSPEQFLAFLLAASVITLAPGPDNMMVLGLGMARGRAAGIAFGLGCAAGCLSHTLLAVLGVSALIAASPQAFTALKIVGGLYLIWLGIGVLRSAGSSGPAAAASSEQSPRALFLRGIVANAINPKVILFFLSFLPQFVVPANGNVGGQLALLGVLFAVQAGVIFGLLGYFAGAIGQRLNRRPAIATLLDRLTAIVFLGLGLRLIFSR